MSGRIATKKSGLTLIEIIITMVLGGILITAMLSQFLALIRFNETVERVSGQTRETPMAVREARVVLSGLARVLRFATNVTPGLDAFTATIEGGHIELAPDPLVDVTITYRIDTLPGPSYELHFVDPSGTDMLISNNVRRLTASWDSQRTVLNIIFFDDNGDFPIETTIGTIT